MTLKTIIKIITIMGIIFSIVFIIWLVSTGIFTSAEKMEAFVNGFGPVAWCVFLLVQTVQVVLPVIPGGISSMAGVVMFGPVVGFVLNYLGMCAGSFIAFAIGGRYGKKLLEKMFDREKIDKYDAWNAKRGRFAKLFALAIAAPGLPDDFLCYLAGTTKMRLKTFAIIIFLCRPITLIGYSVGLEFALGALFFQ
ncbi:MAG: VTT domain-containing protein [Lachnospiraceae bacterium]|nr:VTT domain-containing protein [Lachnospiraceae bacterium]